MPIPRPTGPPARLDEETGGLLWPYAATMARTQTADASPPPITTSARTALGRITPRRITGRGRRGGSLAPVTPAPGPGWPAAPALAMLDPSTRMAAAATRAQQAIGATPPPTAPGRYDATSTGRDFSGALGQMVTAAARGLRAWR